MVGDSRSLSAVLAVPPYLTGPLHHSSRGRCSGRLGCNLVALRTHEFRYALLAGLAAVVVAVVVSSMRRREGFAWRRGPGYGTLLPVAVVAALAATRHLLAAEGAGVALLVLGGWLADHRRLPFLPRLVVLLPGGIVLALAPAVRTLIPAWASLLVCVGTVVGGAAVAVLQRDADLARLGPLFASISAMGLYAVVPDTDFALVLAGAALPLTLLCWRRPATGLGGAGSAGFAGCLCFAAAVGGYGRTSAIIGGVGCLGILLLAPLMLPVIGRARPVSPAGRALFVLGHLALVGYASRVAGRQPFPGRAVVVWAVAEAAAVAALAGVNAQLRRGTGSRRYETI